MIADDRNDPETVSWLDYCRHMNPQLTTAAFEKLIPDFIALGQAMEREHLKRSTH